MVTVSNGWFLLLKSCVLISGIFGLSFFVVFVVFLFWKTRKPRKIFISLFLKVLRLFIWFWALSQAICVFRTQFSKCYSKFLTRTYHWGLKVVLHAIEPQKWYWNNKIVFFFRSFLVMVTDNNGFFLISKASCWFPAFPGLRFTPQRIIENQETTENFSLLIFRGVNTFDAIWNAFKSFCMFIEAWHGC